MRLVTVLVNREIHTPFSDQVSVNKRVGLNCKARHVVLPVILDSDSIVREAYGDCTVTVLCKPSTISTLQQFIDDAE